MSEAFGNDYVVLTDEDGNEVEFQHIDTVEVDGQTYMAFIPAELAVDAEAEVVILKVHKLDTFDEDGEPDEEYVSVDSEEVLNTLFDMFKEQYADEFDFVEE